MATMTTTTAASAATGASAGTARRSWRLREWAFAVAFALYAGFAMVVLLSGLLSAAAASIPALHDWLHLHGLAYSLTGRFAEAMADAAHTRGSGAGVAVDYAVSALNLTLAGLLLWLRPRERTARLLALGMVGTAAVFNLQAYQVYEAMIAGPIDWVHNGLHLVTAASYIAALLLFPDGRMVPHWPRRALVALYVPVTAGIVALAAVIGSASRTLAIILVFGLMTPATGVAAQAYRHRRAQDPIERQQSRLLFWALAPAAAVGALALMPGILTTIQPVYEQRPIPVIPSLMFHVFQLAFTVIPIALIIGLLRFRLWQIDRVISRTLAYGALAVIVALVYVAVVVALGEVLGDRDTFTSVVAVGVVAAAIAPAQQRVQRAANRLVYGPRATPYEVLSTLSERMGDALPAEETMALMARLLAEATAADRADVWLIVGDSIRVAASHPATAGPPASRELDSGGALPDLGLVTATAAVQHGDQLLGALTVTMPRAEVLAPRDQELLTNLAAQAVLVLRNARLTADLVDRLRELRASRQRLVQATDTARRRLEHNLHDGAQQQLVAIKIKLGLAHRMADGDEPLVDLLAGLVRETGDAIDNLRDLARGIYPPLLADQGLVAALRAQAAKAPLDVTVEACEMGRLHQNVEAAVYFCCLEALQNIAKHANAEHAHIDLALDGGAVNFAVHDNGVGFDPDATGRGAGLQNIADRLDALDGALQVESWPGGGTTLRGSLPESPLTEDANT